jgi:2-polyprenyl-3-methyl-5-hydroxy-6-metoxy-1,4-benzoquinol methylase
VACPSCNKSDAVLIGKLQHSSWFAGDRLAASLSGGHLYRCRYCQLKFRYPVQDAAKYHELYDNAATSTWPADTIRRDWDLIVGQILAMRPQGGRVLDFGCYSGGLLGRLGPAYERYGVEINRRAAAIASTTIRLPIWRSIEDIPAGLRFDVIVAADVIEHVPSPVEVIDSLSRLLDNNGVLIITTGDADNFLWNRFGSNWWYCFYPEHIVFLSRAWLEYLSRATGLTVVRCENFRYCTKSTASRIVDTLLAHFYGRFPVAYLRIVGLVKRILGSPGLTSVPGSGLSADHLFVVVTRRSNHEV